MNKYIKIFTIGVLGIYLTSCSKFLDKDPLDQLSSPTFWSNQSEVDMALAGVYARILSSTFDHNTMFWDVLGGDVCANQGSGVVA
jgi:hypothetical protein